MGLKRFTQGALLPRWRIEPNHRKAVRVSAALRDEILEAGGNVRRLIEGDGKLQPDALPILANAGQIWGRDLGDRVCFHGEEDQIRALQISWPKVLGGPIRT